jgi:NAD-dependent dihydropyrimidine dehydrogenase PreA subunit
MIKLPYKWSIIGYAFKFGEKTMTHIITEACVGTCDTACVEVCPVDCIHPTKDNWSDSFKADLSDKQLYINPEDCIDCGACIPECPVEAIYSDDSIPEGQENYVEINAKYFA